MKSDTSRVPEGWLGLDVEGVYVKGNQLVVLGEPNEQIEHNCDAMGCGSLDHVLFRCTIPQWQAVEQRRVPDPAEQKCPICHGEGEVFDVITASVQECDACDGWGISNRSAGG